MSQTPNVVFMTKDGGAVEVGENGITLSSEHSAVELTTHGLNLMESVIAQHTNPTYDLPFNVLNSGFQVTPFIGIFGGPNPLGWGAGVTLINPQHGDIALRCIGVDIEVTGARILLDDIPVATQNHIAVLEERIKLLEDHINATETPVRPARHWAW